MLKDESTGTEKSKDTEKDKGKDQEKDQGKNQEKDQGKDQRKDQEKDKGKDQEKNQGKNQGKDQKKDSSPLPPPSFSALLMSIASTAMVKMGLSGLSPFSLHKREKKDLGLSQYNIDLLDLLREKTKNNLSKEEEELLDSLLNDLKLQFVQASRQTENKPTENKPVKQDPSDWQQLKPLKDKKEIESKID